MKGSTDTSTHGLLQTGIDLPGWQDKSDKVMLWYRWRSCMLTYVFGKSNAIGSEQSVYIFMRIIFN